MRTALGAVKLERDLDMMIICGPLHNRVQERFMREVYGDSTTLCIRVFAQNLRRHNLSGSRPL